MLWCGRRSKTCRSRCQTEGVRYYDSAGQPFVPEMRTRVRVPGREETGEVVDPGKNLRRMYCIGVYFPSTGEVAYYARERVAPAG